MIPFLVDSRDKVEDLVDLDNEARFEVVLPKTVRELATFTVTGQVKLTRFLGKKKKILTPNGLL